MKMQSQRNHLNEPGLMAGGKSDRSYHLTEMSTKGRHGHEMLEHSSHREQTVRAKSTTSKSSKASTRHTKRPPSERRFKCDQCDRMFFTRKDVKRHLVVHTGVRNFACPYCQQRFGRKDHLVRHAKKSHNRDTRTSATFNSSGAQMPSTCARKGSSSTSGNGAHSLTMSMSTNALISGHHYTVPPLPNPSSLDSELTSHLPHPSYGNGHNGHSSGEHHSPSLLILAGHSHLGNGNYTSPPLGESSVSAHHSGGGLHHQDQDHLLQQHHLIKPEPTSHYFPFSVASSSTFAGSPLMTSCFVNNSSRGLCGPSGSHAGLHQSHHHHHHHQLPIPVCGEHGQPGLNPFSLEVNPQLPHFNQAFQ